MLELCYKMKHKKQNILFVCYGNLNRSPTVANVCKQIAEQKNLPINVESAGIAITAETPLTKFIAMRKKSFFGYFVQFAAKPFYSPNA